MEKELGMPESRGKTLLFFACLEERNGLDGQGEMQADPSLTWGRSVPLLWGPAGAPAWGAMGPSRAAWGRGPEGRTEPLTLLPASPGAFAKVKESQRMSDEGRMDQEEADGIRKRCRVVGFALQAEMNHFHERRVADFKRMMQSYLRQQIVFYQRVSQQLEKTLRMYDNL